MFASRRLCCDLLLVANYQKCRELSTSALKLNFNSKEFIRKYFVATADKLKAKARGKMAPILAPTIKLNNGYEMPVLGLGTYELKKGKCEDAVRHAINIGYRHIDSAFLYRNEALIGKVLKEQISKGNVERKDMFLVTKLWNIFHEPEKVRYACQKQLELLDVEYIDLYLMHSPVGYKYMNDDDLMPHENDKVQTNDIDYVDTYKAMEKLIKFGLVRSIGLSNFNSEQIQRILNCCSIKPVINQVEMVECHPFLNQKKMIEFCRERDIIVTSYSPLARPKPTKPTSAVYLSEKIKRISEKYGKSVAQIILRYLLDIGTIPIPKSAHPKRILENICVFDFKLTIEEILILDEFNTGTTLEI